MRGYYRPAARAYEHKIRQLCMEPEFKTQTKKQKKRKDQENPKKKPKRDNHPIAQFAYSIQGISHFLLGGGVGTAPVRGWRRAVDHTGKYVGRPE